MTNKMDEPRKKILIVLLALMGTSILILLNLTIGTGAQWEDVDIGYLGYQKIVFIGDSRTVFMER